MSDQILTITDDGSTISGNLQTGIRVLASSSGWVSFDDFEAADLNVAPDTPSSLGPSSLVDGSSTSDTTPTLEFTLADDDAGQQVQFQVQIDDTSDFSSPVVDYTSALQAQGATSFTVGQAAGSGTYTTGSAGQTLADGSYYWRVRAIDANSEASAYATANSGSVAFVVDTTAPSISSVSATADGTTITVTWNTDVAASSQVEYGETDSYGTTTAETDTSPRVTSHSVSFTVGDTCETYHFQVKSKDAALNEAVSSDNTVKTGSCGGAYNPAVTLPPLPPMTSDGEGEFKVIVHPSSFALEDSSSTTPVVPTPDVTLGFEVGPNVAGYTITNTDSFNDSLLTSYPEDNTIAWNLCSHLPSEDCLPGTYTVSVRFHTRYGLHTEPIMLEVEYDPTADPAPAESEPSEEEQIRQLEEQVKMLQQQVITLLEKLLQLLQMRLSAGQ